MGRRKEFDRDEAVKRAMLVFWEKGFEGTSTEDLLRAMGIGRQSMYDTFGDKRSLYIEALQRYQAESSADLFERLRTASSPLKALGEVLLGIAGEPPATRSKGCMAVNAATEIGQSDADIAAMLNSSALVCEAAFERVVREAKRKGEVRAEVNERTAGKFLLSTIRGLRVSAKAGASSETLRDIAAFAIASLSA